MRYVIVHESQGIFIGIYETIPIFAKTDPIGFTYACSFKTEKDAYGFMETYLPKLLDKVSYVPVDTESKNPSITELLKLGLKDHTYLMMDYLYMPSVKIH